MHNGPENVQPHSDPGKPSPADIALARAAALLVWTDEDWQAILRLADIGAQEARASTKRGEAFVLFFLSHSAIPEVSQAAARELHARYMGWTRARPGRPTGPSLPLELKEKVLADLAKNSIRRTATKFGLSRSRVHRLQRASKLSRK